jgi:aspartyl-tRNA(Asn)/glutamyl-tRNA(Gln) amidotransferase subunit B
VARAGAPARAAASWISVELLRRLKDAGKEIEDCPVAPAALAELLAIVESAAKSRRRAAKKYLPPCSIRGKKRGGNNRVRGNGADFSDTGAIEKIARAVIAKNPENCGEVSQREAKAYSSFSWDR